MHTHAIMYLRFEIDRLTNMTHDISETIYQPSQRPQENFVRARRNLPLVQSISAA